MDQQVFWPRSIERSCYFCVFNCEIFWSWNTIHTRSAGFNQLCKCLRNDYIIRLLFLEHLDDWKDLSYIYHKLNRHKLSFVILINVVYYLIPILVIFACLVQKVGKCEVFITLSIPLIICYYYWLFQKNFSILLE